MQTKSTLERFYSAIVATGLDNVPTIEESARDFAAITTVVYAS